MNEVSAEDIQFLATKGFSFDKGVPEFRRVVGGVVASWTHVLRRGVNLQNVAHWTAMGLPPGEILQLVLSYNEGVDSPITAYVTAELRLWRRQ